MPTSKFITRDFANQEIRQYLKFREESMKQNIFKSLKDPAAREYYSSNEVSFIFRKSELEELFVDPKANAFRIYYAATAEGEPTLVVVACELSDDDCNVTNIIANEEKAARQYPKKADPKGDSVSQDIADDDV